MGMALSAVHKQLSRLPVPYTQKQEDADEYGLCRCCTALAVFTKPFVEELKRKDANGVCNTEDEELKTELLKLYVSVLTLKYILALLCTEQYRVTETVF